MANISFPKVEVGSAALFKDTINTNYDLIAQSIEDVEDNIDNKVIVSDTVPAQTKQNVDGIWIAPFDTNV